MKVHIKHDKVTQIMHGASRNYRYVWDVSLVESLHYNLLSTIQLTRVGYDSLFSEFHVTVFKRDTLKVVFVGHVEGNLYVVDFSKESTCGLSFSALYLY